jgi:hypothetical protein
VPSCDTRKIFFSGKKTGELIGRSDALRVSDFVDALQNCGSRAGGNVRHYLGKQSKK